MTVKPQVTNQPQSPVREMPTTPTKATATTTGCSQPNHHEVSAKTANGDYDPNECAGCGDQLKEGQALIALDRQWHIWCFRYIFLNFFYFIKFYNYNHKKIFLPDARNVVPC